MNYQLMLISICIVILLIGVYITYKIKHQSNKDNSIHEYNSDIEYCTNNSVYNVIQLNEYVSNSENASNNSVDINTPDNNSSEEYTPSDYCIEFVNNSVSSSFISLDDNLNLDVNSGYFISFWVKKNPLTQSGGAGVLIDSEDITLGLRNDITEIRLVVNKYQQLYVDLEGELMNNVNWNNITINVKGMDKSVSYYINGKKINLSKTTGKTNVGPNKHDYLNNEDHWETNNVLPIKDWWNTKSQTKYNKKISIGNAITPSIAYGFNGWIDRIVYNNGHFDDDQIKNIYTRSQTCQ